MRDRDEDRHTHEGREANDQPEELQRALKKEHRPDLQGDAEENRNLSGSSTWETLTDEGRGED